MHKGMIILLRKNHMISNILSIGFEVPTIPYSSSNLIVSLEVSQAGAVHPFGFLPVNLVSTSIDLARTSRCCCSLN